MMAMVYKYWPSYSDQTLASLGVLVLSKLLSTFVDENFIQLTDYIFSYLPVNLCLFACYNREQIQVSKV